MVFRVLSVDVPQQSSNSQINCLPYAMYCHEQMLKFSFDVQFYRLVNAEHIQIDSLLLMLLLLPYVS